MNNNHLLCIELNVLQGIRYPPGYQWNLICQCKYVSTKECPSLIWLDYQSKNADS